MPLLPLFLSLRAIINSNFRLQALAALGGGRRTRVGLLALINMTAKKPGTFCPAQTWPRLAAEDWLPPKARPPLAKGAPSIGQLKKMVDPASLRPRGGGGGGA